MARARFNFQFDATKFKKKCAQLGREFGVTGEAVLADQMRLWAIDALEHTYPGARGKDKMRQKVERQIRGLFHGMTRAGMIQVLKDNFGGGKRGMAKAMAAHAGAIFDTRGDQASMREFHNKHRDSTGDVVFNRQKIGDLRIRGGKTMPIFNKYYTTTTARNRFLRDRLARVGILMAGWIPAIKYFESISRAKAANTRQIPAWVNKARIADPYKTQPNNANDFDKATLKGDMTMSHVIPYNDDLKLWDITRRLARTRQADLEKNLRLRMKQIAKRFEAGVAA